MSLGASTITSGHNNNFSTYLLVSEFYIKRRLNIKRIRKGTFRKGRKKVFIIIEVALMIFFITTTFMFLDYFSYSPIIRSLPIFIFFFSVSLLRGIEEWIVKKSDRSYYYEWLASITFLIMILFITFVKMVRY